MKRLLAIVGIAVLSMIGISSSANALSSDCASGYFCVWDGYSYSGTMAGSAFDVSNYNNHSTLKHLNDKATSVSNNGNYKRVKACEHPNYQGECFVVRNASRNDATLTIRDPNLTNGVGQWSYNFNDKLSSHYWY